MSGGCELPRDLVGWVERLRETQHFLSTRTGVVGSREQLDPTYAHHEFYDSGSGMNSTSSPGTRSKRAAFQSFLACSMRSLREETKFHQMWRGPSIVAPPSSTKCASPTAVTVTRSPGRKISRRPAEWRSPAMSTSPAIR